LEYANLHLHTPLFVVMGHDGCGAVQAAVASMLHGVVQRSRIQALLENILPALDGIDRNLPPDELLRVAVTANVRWTMKALRESPEGGARLATGAIRLVGAVYELGTGRVNFLEG
jgi:carbonic anhydrase